VTAESLRSIPLDRKFFPFCETEKRREGRKEVSSRVLFCLRRREGPDRVESGREVESEGESTAVEGDVGGDRSENGFSLDMEEGDGMDWIRRRKGVGFI